jgi:hypothetical protein
MRFTLEFLALFGTFGNAERHSHVVLAIGVEDDVAEHFEIFHRLVVAMDVVKAGGTESRLPSPAACSTNRAWTKSPAGPAPDTCDDGVSWLCSASADGAKLKVSRPKKVVVNRRKASIVASEPSTAAILGFSSTGSCSIARATPRSAVCSWGSGQKKFPPRPSGNVVFSARSPRSARISANHRSNRNTPRLGIAAAQQESIIAYAGIRPAPGRNRMTDNSPPSRNGSGSNTSPSATPVRPIAGRTTRVA